MRDRVFAVGAIVFVAALLLAVVHYASSSPASNAAAISSRNPAQKDSAWEADGARQAIAGAKELCKQAGAQLLDSSAKDWDDAKRSFGVETSPGRYRVKRSAASHASGRSAHRTVDCKIRRDGDHFQLIAIDTTG